LRIRVRYGECDAQQVLALDHISNLKIS
jgi:sulfite reductase beta subunit-like hemoprotein